MKLPEISEIEKAIGSRTQLWVGSCYAVAEAIIEAGLIKGRPQYGFYFGPVSPQSLLYTECRSLYRHGWILCEDADLIVDPTRWVFEAVDPYLFVTTADDSHYDYGMNRFRAASLRPPPDPLPNAQGEIDWVELKPGSADVRNLICGIFGVQAGAGEPVRLAQNQLVYLGSYPMHILEPHAREVYELLIENDAKACIPLDNRRAVLSAEEV